MALDTINIPNTVGATLRTNINDALEASATAFSGTIQPTTGTTGLASLIGVLWYDTTNSVLKVGTAAGGAFVVVDAAVDVGATSVGGDLSGTVSSASIKANAVGTSEIDSGAVTNDKITGMAAIKLTGALPAISGAALTNLPAGGTIGGLLVHQMTNGSGMFTVPAGVTKLVVTGAGSGGTGVRRDEGQPSGGGGAGACCVRTQVTVTAGATVSWSVGAGVAGSTSGSFGNNGNATTVTGGGVSITLGGGGRGNLANGGGGGTATVTGGAANLAFTAFSGTGGVSVSQGAGGGGGSNFWGPFGSLLSGPGDPNSSATVNGGVGVGPGGGGGGGVNQIASSRAGALIIEIGVA